VESWKWWGIWMELCLGWWKKIKENKCCIDKATLGLGDYVVYNISILGLSKAWFLFLFFVMGQSKMPNIKSKGNEY
jgi:hypothetical protein